MIFLTFMRNPRNFGPFLAVAEGFRHKIRTVLTIVTFKIMGKFFAEKFAIRARCMKIREIFTPIGHFRIF